MSPQDTVNKLWNLCNVLRDDGITYHQYVTELTYVLFLKMAKETGAEERIPAQYRWDRLLALDESELLDFYRQMLLDLGKEAQGRVQEIYQNAQTNIRRPANLKTIITAIEGIDWFELVDELKDDARYQQAYQHDKYENLGELYEGLLEKNAAEKKSGAGQYFTPRPLIDVMVRMLAPKAGEYCHDPSAGTFGFMIAVDRYLRDQYDDYYAPEVDKAFQTEKALTGVELVPDTHRLALMNAMLHGLHAPILLEDALSNQGANGIAALAPGGFDLILANPPFGTKRGGEKPTRTDLQSEVETSNKQLNFLMAIYLSLHRRGGARAGVVLPDNVLFEDGAGREVRQKLMNKCNLHTILRLPTGIFYAQGVKTNVLFFERGTTEEGNTKRVWYYDLRSEMDSFGKRNPLSLDHFAPFERAYEATDRHAIDDPRWSSFSRAEIAERGDTLDLGLMRSDNGDSDSAETDPVALTEQALAELDAAMGHLQTVLTLMQDGRN